MRTIYNDLTHNVFPGLSKEELKALSVQYSEAADGLLSGIHAIGNLMFWAADSENYMGDMVIDDTRRLGEMLMNVSEIVRALNDTSINADYTRYTMETKSK